MSLLSEQMRRGLIDYQIICYIVIHWFMNLDVISGLSLFTLKEHIFNRILKKQSGSHLKRSKADGSSFVSHCCSSCHLSLPLLQERGPVHSAPLLPTPPHCGVNKSKSTAATKFRGTLTHYPLHEHTHAHTHTNACSRPSHKYRQKHTCT